MTPTRTLPLPEDERRALFPVCREHIFFSHAAVAALPAPAAERMARYAMESATAPQEFAETLRDIKAARGTCARLLGAAPEEIALLGPTSPRPQPLCQWPPLAGRRRSPLLPRRLPRQCVPVAGAAPARRDGALPGAGAAGRNHPRAGGRLPQRAHPPRRSRLLPFLPPATASTWRPSAACSTRARSSFPSMASSRSAPFP